MGLLCFIYMILSIRTNLVFFGIFFTLVPAFGCLAGAFWNLAADATANADRANKLLIAAGAFTFVTDILGWYLFFVILMASLDFPFQLPGKLSDEISLLIGAELLTRC